MIYPDGFGYDGFQIDCGIRSHSKIRYGFKRSFRLMFTQEFGPSKLRYPIFESAPANAESAAKRFDKLVLRAGWNDA